MNHKRHISIAVAATVFVSLLAVASSVAALTALPVNASAGLGLSPAVVNFGQLHRGASATQTVYIYNLGSSAIRYTVAIENIPGVTASPASGSIAANSRVAVHILVHITNSAKNGSYSGLLLVSTNTVASGHSGVWVALDGRIEYKVA